MVVTLKQAIQSGRPFRAKYKNSHVNSHSAKTGHVWRLPYKDMGDEFVECVHCKRMILIDFNLTKTPDEWILDIDDDDSEFEEKAKDILKGMGIKVREEVEV